LNRAVRPPEPRPAVADPALQRPDWTRAEDRDPNALWLDKNENTDPALAAVVAQVVAEVGRRAQFAYPDLGGLYRKLARFTGVPAENLLLAAGSDGAIRAAFEAYVSPGDAVVLTRPTFAMYGVNCQIFGARPVALEYAPSNRGPALAADQVIRSIESERPRLVCLPNPDSPTGTVFSQAELRAIIAAAAEAGAVMLIDEAYFPFLPDTVLPWVLDNNHLIVTRSTGKAWGLAGFRIGYAAASSGVAAALHKVRAMYETSTFAAAVFERMLDHEAEMTASVARLEAGKAEFLDAMESLGFRVLRGAGNFMHVAFGADADAVRRALQGNVYYRPDFREPCLKGFSRFSATTPALFAPVIARIQDAVVQNRASRGDRR
jgi:histidinol-phosphate aminotransferase